MNKITAILFLGLPLLMYAQKVKKVVDKSTGQTEIYYVLKSDGKTKQGSYQKLSTGNKPDISGYFTNGLMDSTWTEFSAFGNIISTGKYHLGNKTGVWEYYTVDGSLEQKYDFDKRKLLYNASAQKGNPHAVLLGADSVNASESIRAVFLGGDALLLKFLQYNIRYPAKAYTNDIQGKVEITFVIDNDGKASGYRISKRVFDELDQEALRVIKLLPQNWIPATLNGKPVASEYSIPVVFRLQ